MQVSQHTIAQHDQSTSHTGSRSNQITPSSMGVHPDFDASDLPLLGRWAKQLDNRSAGVAGTPRGTSAINIGLANLLTCVECSDSDVSMDSIRIPNMVFTPKANQNWGKIASFNPVGHIQDQKGNVSIASTPVLMKIPEITEALRSGDISEDGEIIEDGHVKAVKIAIDYTYSLDGLSERFNEFLERSGSSKITTAQVREALFAATKQPDLLNEDTEFYQPSLDGPTVYIFGDPEKIGLDVETTVRIQNSCNSSDVFHSDICSCRPNLMYGVEEAVKSAQEGGVGIIVYVAKEGRGLGQVPKFSVYNVRSDQEGGDRPDKYFEATRHVMRALTNSSIQDAARPELEGPDVLMWLGVNKIDKFVSDNRQKAAALEKAGIEIKDLLPLPTHLIPKGAWTEMTAKGSVASAMNKYAVDKNSESDDAPKSSLKNALAISPESVNQMKNAVIVGLLGYIMMQHAKS